MQEIITSIKNEKLRNVTLLQKKKKAREEQGLFVTEGTRIFEDALKSAAESIEQIFISESFSKSPEWNRLTKSPEWIKFTKSSEWSGNAQKTKPSGNSTGKNGSGIFTVADDVFGKICETVTPQGILCVIRKKKYELGDLSIEKLLLLENIQDPGNLGTMIRTAEAAGITGVIMSSDTVEIYSPKVTRSTMGSIFRVPFLYTDDICDTIDSLKDRNVTVYGAYLRNGRPFNTIRYQQPCAVLIGNEGNGISDRAIERVSERVFIPMCGGTESLNAAVAAALIMYQWM